MQRNDESYYRGRALQEQLAAQRAASEPAKKVHDQLAAMYRFRVTMQSRSASKWSGPWEEELQETH